MKLLALIYLSTLSIIWLSTSCTPHRPMDTNQRPVLPDSSALPHTEAESIFRAQSYFHLGQSYQQHEQIPEAIDAYLHALMSMPTGDSLVESILKESHTLEMRKQNLTTRHRRNIAFLIICSLSMLLVILFLFLYFNNRHRKKHIKLQQLLMKNQVDKAQQKNELKQLLHHQLDIEKENQEMQERLFELWKHTIQISARLFQTTASYRQLMLMETSKLKRDREKSHEEIAAIQEEINEVFVKTLQGLSEMSTGLTTDDLLFCLLNYLNFSATTTKICMRVESSQALAQRKYRIKKHLDPQVFAFFFESSPTREINNVYSPYSSDNNLLSADKR